MKKHLLIATLFIAISSFCCFLLCLLFIPKKNTIRTNNKGGNTVGRGPVTRLLLRPPQVPGSLTSVDPVRFDAVLVTISQGGEADQFSIVSEGTKSKMKVSVGSRIETVGGLVCTTRPNVMISKEPRGLVMTQICVKQGHVATVRLSGPYMHDGMVVIEFHGKEAISVYNEDAITNAINSKLGTKANVHAFREVSTEARKI